MDETTENQASTLHSEVTNQTIYTRDIVLSLRSGQQAMQGTTPGVEFNGGFRGSRTRSPVGGSAAECRTRNNHLLITLSYPSNLGILASAWRFLVVVSFFFLARSAVSHAEETRTGIV